MGHSLPRLIPDRPWHNTDLVRIKCDTSWPTASKSLRTTDLCERKKELRLELNILETAKAGTVNRMVILSWYLSLHYSDVITGAMASQIASLAIVFSTVYSGADQRKHQSSASLSFVRGIHRWQVIFFSLAMPEGKCISCDGVFQVQ